MFATNERFPPIECNGNTKSLTTKGFYILISLLQKYKSCGQALTEDIHAIYTWIGLDNVSIVD